MLDINKKSFLNFFQIERECLYSGKWISLFLASGGSGSIHCEWNDNNVRFRVNIPKHFNWSLMVSDRLLILIHMDRKWVNLVWNERSFLFQCFSINWLFAGHSLVLKLKAFKILSFSFCISLVFVPFLPS